MGVVGVGVGVWLGVGEPDVEDGDVGVVEPLGEVVPDDVGVLELDPELEDPERPVELRGPTCTTVLLTPLRTTTEVLVSLGCAPDPDAAPGEDVDPAAGAGLATGFRVNPKTFSGSCECIALKMMAAAATAAPTAARPLSSRRPTVRGASKVAVCHGAISISPLASIPSAGEFGPA